ncbi:MAG: integrase core domain-containing protein [Candidatus Eisenbacteria sp.]|nr:integrase core domain-containing protein [Candidatus Eisenbacteria bacterium]
MACLAILFRILSETFRSRASLQIENLALRHQLAVLRRSCRRPRIRSRDRIFWSWLSRVWSGWRGALVIVRPETVLAWRRRKFREYWRKLSRSGKPGRPSIPREVRDLIRRMSTANPLWGAPRIVGELGKIGIDVPKSTVAKYMVRRRRPPSATWRAFLKSHIRDIVAVDFFVVPTVRNRILFVFLILAHDRRRVLHFDVTANPTAEWTAQQIVEAFPWEEAPRYLLRDRDGIYGEHFRRRVRNMGIEQVVIASRSPWQNPYVERLVGSIRRECLDHTIVLSERHLKRILTDYFRYYHRWRTHQSLGMDCPEHREAHSVACGLVSEIPEVGGLHHHYERVAA